MKNKISIVIPTYKRKKCLENLLHSLKRKVDKGVEIIIVEQGENNKGTYFKIAKKLGLSVGYFFLSKKSTAHAKNIGIQKAKGDIIVFFDDDILLKSRLDNYIKDLQNKKIAAVTGRSIAQGQRVEANNNCTGRISSLGGFSDGYSSTIPQEIDTVIGCNAAWRKDVLQKLHGFDEKFTGNAMREESDLSLRAKKMGYKILFDPRVEVLHVRAESGGARKIEGRMQWYFDFFSNETYFFLRHRPLLLVPLIILSRWEWAFRCMFGFGREVSMRSLLTPFLGIIDGYKKYENRG